MKVKMEITDVNGIPLQIDDLTEALGKSDDFIRHYNANKPYSEFEKRQQIYWEDMHEKLTKIQMKLARPKSKKRCTKPQVVQH